jgi:hypothetical protein
MESTFCASPGPRHQAPLPMSFEIDGFFSPEIERFREAMRTTAPFCEWLAYARALNRIGLNLLRQASSIPNDPRLFAMHGHFVRAHRSFQGAVLLAEVGSIPDARTVVRSGVESAIALHALAKDSGFVDRMVEAHHMHQRKVARIVLGNSAYLAAYSAQDVATMHAAIAEADKLEASLQASADTEAKVLGIAPKKRKLLDIDWAATAMAHCPDLYQLIYRSHSSDGTHATVNSLDRFLETDATGRAIAFKVAPDTDGVVEALTAACLLFIWAAEPFAVSFDRPDVSAELSKQIQAFATLPGAFPTRVAP